jgi:hypothetical protein
MTLSGSILKSKDEAHRIHISSFFESDATVQP